MANGGDPLEDNPSGQWAYMPASVGAACIGRSSCVIEQADGTLSSVAFDASSTGAGSPKFKIIAVCSGAATSTGMSSAQAASLHGKCQWVLLHGRIGRSALSAIKDRQYGVVPTEAGDLVSDRIRGSLFLLQHLLSGHLPRPYRVSVRLEAG